MNLSDMLGDPATIGRMDDSEFGEYWSALGKAVRIACRVRKPPAPDEPERSELSCTSASTERAAGWDLDKRHPVVAVRTTFGFGRQR